MIPRGIDQKALAGGFANNGFQLFFGIRGRRAADHAADVAPRRKNLKPRAIAPR
jgi:hypothetical protein